MTIQRFEDLKVWQEARKLVRIIYRLTKRESFSSDRDLRWQLQGASVSCMGNIAEAHGRYTFEEKRRFLDISLGSCKELQSHLYVALDQAYIEQNDFDEAYIRPNSSRSCSQAPWPTWIVRSRAEEPEG